MCTFEQVKSHDKKGILRWLMKSKAEMWTRRRELAAYLRSQQLLLARHRRGWDWDRVQFTVKMKTPVKTRTMPSEDSHRAFSQAQCAPVQVCATRVRRRLGLLSSLSP